MIDILEVGRVPRLVPWCAWTSALILLVGFLPPMDGVLVGLALVGLTLMELARASRPRSGGPIYLFALTSLLFVWARPIVAMSSPEFDLRVIEGLGGIGVSRTGLEIYLRTVAASLLAFATTTHFVATAGHLGPLPVPRPVPPGSHAREFWIGCFVLGAAAYTLQAAMYAVHFLRGGTYFELFLLGKDAVTLPGLSLVASLMFLGYVGLLTQLQMTRRERAVWTVLFVVVSMVGLLRGSRGEVFCQVLVSVWLYHLVARRSPSPVLWGSLLASLALIAEAVNQIRAGLSIGDGGEGLLNGLSWFVYSQGISGELVAPAHEAFGVDVGNVRFLLYPLLAPLRQIVESGFGTQSDAHGQASGLLSHELAYRLNPDLYMAGHGVGSTYLAETYVAFGIAGVVAATGAIVWLLGRGARAALTSDSARFLLACVLPYVLFVPRETLFFFVVPGLKAVLALKISSMYEGWRSSLGPGGRGKAA